MIFYTGLGYLVIIVFFLPLIIGGALLYYGVGIDVLNHTSRLPLHLLMVIGAVLIFVIGWYANRNMIEEVTYEKSGPVTKLRPRHTFYGIRMEYWGPIAIVIYFALVSYRYFR